MGVIRFVFLVLGLCSGELFSMNTSPEMLVHNESSIDIVSENATGVATGGQQTQLEYSGDKENIILVGNTGAAVQSNRISTESQVESRTVDDSVDSFNKNLVVSNPEHSVTSERSFTAASVFNGSIDRLNTANKILSEVSWWKDINDHNSVKPGKEANYTSGGQAKLFQKLGIYFKAVESTKSKPAITEHDRAQNLRRKYELMSGVVSGDQSSSGQLVSLSDNSGEIAEIDQNLNTSDIHKIMQNDGLERVVRSTNATTEISMPKSSLNKRSTRYEIPENLVLNYSETAEVTTKENVDFEFALINNSTDESDETYRDSQGNVIPCNAKLSVPINDADFINGSLHSSEYNVTFPPGFFWQDVNNTYLGCICSLLPCMRKCCSKDMMYPPKGDVCIPRTAAAEPFTPKYFDENTYEPVEVDEDPVVLYGMPCKFAYRLDPKYDDEENYLLPNGSILLPNYNTTIEADEYCMEIFEGREGIAVLKCFPDDINYDYEEDDLAAMILYPTGMLISIPFLLVTFFVYGIISELRNLHGKSLMCHVSSLAVAYIFLSTVQLGHKKLNPTACVTFAFIIFFAFLASFFWLNVMCFDIFWTFSGIRPLRGSIKERENKKFVMYSCYAWGAPFLLLIICIIMDFVPGIPADAIKPELGLTKCWFSNDPALTAYFFGPVGTLLVCNMLFFIITAIRIFQLKQETAMLKGADSRKSDDKANTQRFKLYLKLFVVMGVTWVMEVVSYVVGGPTSMWYVPDLCNTLQGLLIFLLFVWKKNVRVLLARKFGKKSEPRSTTGSQRSHIPTSRTTSITTLKDRSSTIVTDSNSIHLKPIKTNSNIYN